MTPPRGRHPDHDPSSETALPARDPAPSGPSGNGSRRAEADDEVRLIDDHADPAGFPDEPTSPHEPEPDYEHDDQRPDETLISQQFLCPYCGYIGFDPQRCPKCRGFFEPLSRQATQNHMGPWQLRAPRSPFQPPFSYEMLRSLVQRGKITRYSILRGPTTRQFWSFACNTPGVAVLLGECHSCHAEVQADEYLCPQCNAVLSPPHERQHLGLAPVKLLPGHAPPEAVATSSMAAPQPQPRAPRSQPRPAAHAARPHLAPQPHETPIPQPAGPAPIPRSSSLQHHRETSRRLRERLRFMTGALIFAIVIIVAMLVLFAVAMLAGNASFRFARPEPQGGAPQQQQQQQAQQPTPQPTQAPTESPAATKTEPDSAAPEASEFEPPSAASLLDPGLGPWEADIRRAAELEKRDTLEDLQRAAAILRRVLDEARAVAIDNAIDDPEFPLLQARIDRLTERIDRLSLRDIFD